MFKSLFPTMLGAVAILAAVAAPAAADDIEARVQVCGTCHGPNGEPADPKTMPIIWGQQENFLVKQLHDYRAGDRNNPIMASMAKTLSQEDLRPAAAYFAMRVSRSASPSGPCSFAISSLLWRSSCMWDARAPL